MNDEQILDYLNMQLKYLETKLYYDCGRQLYVMERGGISGTAHTNIQDAIIAFKWSNERGWTKQNEEFIVTRDKIINQFK